MACDASIEPYGCKEQQSVKKSFFSKVAISLFFICPCLYEHEVPYPLYDHCGYEVAITILPYSRRKGKHSKEYCQFETINKLQSVFSNHCRTNPQANQTHLSIVDSLECYSTLSSDKCGCLWFQWFIDVCQKRMGVVWKPNTAMSIALF